MMTLTNMGSKPTKLTGISPIGALAGIGFPCAKKT
jgi:hypothetical protein